MVKGGLAKNYVFSLEDFVFRGSFSSHCHQIKHSTDVAYLLLTQQPLVRFPFPSIF